MVAKRYLYIFFLLLLPLCVFAHGEEVLITLFLPVIPGIIFIIVINRLQMQNFGKGILVVIYVLSLFLSFYLIKNWPYNQNAVRINYCVALAPPTITFLAFWPVRKRERNLIKKKQLDSFPDN